jgi:hypothetical protein
MTTYQVSFTNGVAVGQGVGQVTILRSGIVRSVQFMFACLGALAAGTAFGGYCEVSRTNVPSTLTNGPINATVALSAVSIDVADTAGSAHNSVAPVSNLIPTAFRVSMGDILYLNTYNLDLVGTAPLFYGLLLINVED